MKELKPCPFCGSKKIIITDDCENSPYSNVCCCCDFNQGGCGFVCTRCKMLQMIWLMEEYEEHGVDWSKVEVDTPILVRDGEDCKWIRRHFAKYEDGDVYAWSSGCTSWSETGTRFWKYAKLAESE